jgi:hypothetical protein
MQVSLDIIEKMGDFAAKTKNDTLSCYVARIVEKLIHQGAPFERRRITEAEKRIIRMFM